MSDSDIQPFIFRQQPPPDLTALRIEGQRVILPAIHEKFAAEIFTEFNAEITRYMFPKPAETIDETLAFITDSLAKMRRRTDLVLAIAHREGEFLGCCGLHITQGYRTPELGIWLKKSAHGNGYGKEAIELLTTWAVVNLEFAYAIYPVDKANIPSRKIPEALGGFVISEQKVEAMTGHVLDEVVYKILYETLRARHNSGV